MSALAVTIPKLDYAALSPLFALVGGTCLVLLGGLFPGRFVQRLLMPVLTLAVLCAAIGLTIWTWEPGEERLVISDAMSMDTLTLGLSMLFFTAGIVTVLLSMRGRTMRSVGGGELYGLMLASITGMVVLAGAENLVVLFVGFELLSIPLFVLCGSRIREQRSLEAGLKYLVVGSVGSATLLYGLALIYGAAGTMQFGRIEAALGDTVQLGDPLLLTGLALALVGLAFKASVAPFHQWTPDVYQGAPTPVTAFMAVATKAAAFAVLLRFLDRAMLPAIDDWAPAVAALAAFTIVVGNVGAIAARSLKRMLAWSGVGQAGYMLVGVVVGTRLGVQATVFYLAVYLAMNMAAFAVVIARERVSEVGDDIRSLDGLGRAAPWLAWPMTIAMLALAGFPATGGFIGKFYLIDAAVSDDWTWLGIAIVVGSMISLVYYLRVLAVMWMGPVDIELPSVPRRRVPRMAGWSPEADAKAQPELVLVAVLAAATTIWLGVWPDPLFDAARDIGSAFTNLR